MKNFICLLPVAEAPYEMPSTKEGREGGYQIPVPSLNLAQIPVPRLIFAKIPVTKFSVCITALFALTSSTILRETFSEAKDA